MSDRENTAPASAASSRAGRFGLTAAMLIGGLSLAAMIAGPSTETATDAGADPAIHQVKVPVGMDARSTAIFLTGADGWTPEHEARASRLADLHTLVIGLDGAALLADSGGDCTAVADRIAEIASQIQNREGAFARAPVLTAFGDTADLALGMVHERPKRFKGLVTDGYAPAEGACTLADFADLGGKAPLRWLDVVPVGGRSPARDLAGVKVVEAKAGPRKAFYRAYLGVAGTDSSFDVTTGVRAADLDDLPLTIHDTALTGRGDTYAIFLSGDGGWARFDEEVADRLAAADIPVVGISALRYMWQKKQPERVARDIARIDGHFRERFARDRVLLIGFSIGANTMAFAGQHLPADLRARLAGVGLLAPEVRTGFEIVVGGWLGQETGAHEVAPAITALTEEVGPDRVACLYGTEETATPCPALTDLPMRFAAFEGGHHLGKAYDRIAEVLSDLAAAPSAADLAVPLRTASGG